MKLASLAAAMAERYEREAKDLITVAIATTMHKLGCQDIVFLPADLEPIGTTVIPVPYTTADGRHGMRLEKRG